MANNKIEVIFSLKELTKALEEEDFRALIPCSVNGEEGIISLSAEDLSPVFSFLSDRDMDENIGEDGKDEYERIMDEILSRADADHR